MICKNPKSFDTLVFHHIQSIWNDHTEKKFAVPPAIYMLSTCWYSSIWWILWFMYLQTIISGDSYENICYNTTNDQFAKISFVPSILQLSTFIQKQIQAQNTLNIYQNINYFNLFALIHYMNVHHNWVLTCETITSHL